MSDFPRGWTLNNFHAGDGVAASITVAATPGVVHVLDSFVAKMTNNSTAGATASNITVVTAAGTVLTTSVIVAGAAVGTDESSFSGLDIASSVGGTIVVSFSAVAAAGITEILTIQGHDI